MNYKPEPLPLRSLGLVYVSDSDPGIRRMRRGKGFSYLDPEGKPVTARETLSRIRSLVIPPAWANVWICAIEQGHLQATGRDARNRKQYRYHPEWVRVRNETKFDRLLEFGEHLAALRQTIQADLRAPGLAKRKVVALALALLDETHIRIGNEEYARTNNTYGLTTLQDRHAQVEGSRLRLRFRAKGGKIQQVDLRERRLARLVKACRDIPGQMLFQYETEDGGHEPIGSGDINVYLLQETGTDFTAKFFRTWAGTVHATAFLWEAGPLASKRAREKKVVEAVKFVAEVLNNTPATCKKYYIHPAVLEAYVLSTFFETIKRRRTRKAWKGLQRGEKSVMKLLLHTRQAG